MHVSTHASSSLNPTSPSSDVHILDDATLPAWLAAPGVACLDFTAAWCGPCRQLKPILASLAVRYRGRIRFAEIDVATAPQATAILRVVSMPTLVLWRDGAAVGRVIGARPTPYLIGALDRALAGDVAIAGP